MNHRAWAASESSSAMISHGRSGPAARVRFDACNSGFWDSGGRGGGEGLAVDRRLRVQAQGSLADAPAEFANPAQPIDAIGVDGRDHVIAGYGVCEAHRCLPAQSIEHCAVRRAAPRIGGHRDGPAADRGIAFELVDHEAVRVDEATEAFRKHALTGPNGLPTVDR